MSAIIIAALAGIVIGAGGVILYFIREGNAYKRHAAANSHHCRSV